MSHSNDSPIHLVIHDQPLDDEDGLGPESESTASDRLLEQQQQPQHNTQNHSHQQQGEEQRRNGSDVKQSSTRDSTSSSLAPPASNLPLAPSHHAENGSSDSSSSATTRTPPILSLGSAASRLRNVQQHLIDLSGPPQKDGNASSSSSRTSKMEYSRPLQPPPFRSSITPSSNNSTQPKSNSHSSRRVQFHTPLLPSAAVDFTAVANDPLLLRDEEDSPDDTAAAEKQLKETLISLYQPKTNGTPAAAVAADGLVSPPSTASQKNVTPTVPNALVPAQQSKDMTFPTSASSGSDKLLATVDSRATLHKSANSASSLGDGTKRALTPTNPLHVSLRTSTRFRRLILVLCLMAVTIVAITMALSFHQLAQVQSSLREFQNSENISNYTSSLLEALLNGETGTRGYQLTGAPLYLQPYNDSLITVPLYYNQLAAVVSPSDFHINALNELTTLIANISV